LAERSHRDDVGTGLSPDELEQRQRADGTWEETSVVDDDADEPLTPDMIEQRQVVEDDSDDAPRE
jgi:hypothetical protein